MRADMSVTQEHELMAWQRIRGPLGPTRWDHYVRMLCMYASGPHADPKSVHTGLFTFPWDDPPKGDGRPKPGPIVPAPPVEQPQPRRPGMT